jgi:hypothetical protein
VDRAVARRGPRSELLMRRATAHPTPLSATLHVANHSASLQRSQAIKGPRPGEPPAGRRLEARARQLLAALPVCASPLLPQRDASALVLRDTMLRIAPEDEVLCSSSSTMLGITRGICITCPALKDRALALRIHHGDTERTEGKGWARKARRSSLVRALSISVVNLPCRRRNGECYRGSLSRSAAAGAGA